MFRFNDGTGFVPQNQRLLVELKKPEEKSAGGIILTEPEDHDYRIAEVVVNGFGPWLEREQQYQCMEWSVGDQIMIQKHGGLRFPSKEDYGDLLIIHQNDVLGIVLQKDIERD